MKKNTHSLSNNTITKQDLKVLREDISKDFGEIINGILTQMSGRFDKQDLKFDKIDKRFDKQDLKFDKIDKRFDKQDFKFDKIDKKFDKQDSRFKKIDNKFDKVDERFDKQDARFDKIDKKFDKVDERFDLQDKKIDYKFKEQEEIFNKNFDAKFAQLRRDLLDGNLQIIEELKSMREEREIVIHRQNTHSNQIEKNSDEITFLKNNCILEYN